MESFFKLKEYFFLKGNCFLFEIKLVSNKACTPLKRKAVFTQWRRELQSREMRKRLKRKVSTDCHESCIQSKKYWHPSKGKLAFLKVISKISCVHICFLRKKRIPVSNWNWRPVTCRYDVLASAKQQTLKVYLSFIAWIFGRGRSTSTSTKTVLLL